MPLTGVVSESVVPDSGTVVPSGVMVVPYGLKTFLERTTRTNSSPSCSIVWLQQGRWRFCLKARFMPLSSVSGLTLGGAEDAALEADVARPCLVLALVPVVTVTGIRFQFRRTLTALRDLL